jgi:hypothetical protein
LRRICPPTYGQLGPEDRFYFFYAGHGLFADGGNLPVDRRPAWRIIRSLSAEIASVARREASTADTSAR